MATATKIAKLARPMSDAAPPATEWQPGPDASGVFRRHPGMEEYVTAKPELLIDGRWQPRQTIREDKLGELTDSVREHGVLEPLIAVVNEQGNLELVTGHRRKRAAIRALLREVPMRVLELTAEQARLLAIVSNDDRDDLTDVERGAAYEQAITTGGISEAELARRLNRPRAYIQQRRALVGAAPEVGEQLAQGKLTFSQVRGLINGAGGDADVQRAALKRLAGRPSWQGPATEKEMQAYATEAVLDVAEERLEHLGWFFEHVYVESKPAAYIYGGNERPAVWSSAEILKAVKEQRRPKQGEKPAFIAITPAIKRPLNRRGWSIISGTRCDPWVLVKTAKAKFLTGSELADVVAQADADIEALAKRLKPHQWKIDWNDNGGCSGHLRGPNKESTYFWSWRDLLRDVGLVEAGTASNAEPQKQCPRCDAMTHELVFSPIKRENVCAACAEQERQEYLTALEQQRAALATRWQPWLAAAPLEALQLLVHQGAHATQAARQLLGLDCWAKPEEVVAHVCGLDQAGLIAAYTLLVVAGEADTLAAYRGEEAKEVGE